MPTVKAPEDKTLLIAQVYTVDADMAKLLLEYEKQPEVGVVGTNRNASPETVEEYARRMLAGEWRLTHQGLAFKGFLDDDTAELADGGHRLRAVLRAADTNPDIAIKFMLTQGLTEEDVLAMDIGRRRTTSDFLRMHGETDTYKLAAMARLTWLYFNVPYESLDAWRKIRLSPEQQQTHLTAHPRLRDAVSEGSRLAKLMTSTAAGAGWYLGLHSGRDEAVMREFMDKLFWGDDIPKGNAIHTLRQLLINSRDYHRRWETPELLALFIKTYLKWESGQESRQLSFRVGEEFPRF